VDEMSGAYSMHCGDEKCVQILIGNPDGKRPYLKTLHLKETGWVSVDWIHLAQDRNHWRALVNAIMDLQVP
jgi:hypothetical protein